MASTAAPPVLTLTKYEACEIVSGRAMLLAAGSATLLDESDIPEARDFVRIANRELLLGKIDAVVERCGVQHHVSTMQLPDNVHNLA